jgi:hypothetical protein
LPLSQLHLTNPQMVAQLSWLVSKQRLVVMQSITTNLCVFDFVIWYK